MAQQPEITTMSEKGQVVIPQSIRKEMRIKPQTKFVVFGSGDTLIMKKLELPNLEKEWREIFHLMDRKRLKLTEKQVLAEIGAIRQERRGRKHY
jgi:AbrB family looped-hinge helix DNA binding protein